MYLCLMIPRVFSEADLRRLGDAAGIALGPKQLPDLEWLASAWFDDRRWRDAEDARAYANARKLADQLLEAVAKLPIFVTPNVERLRAELLLFEDGLRPPPGRPDDWDAVTACYRVLHGLSELGCRVTLPSNEAPLEMQERQPLIFFTRLLVSIILEKVEQGWWPAHLTTPYRQQVLRRLQALNRKSARAWVELFRTAREVPPHPTAPVKGKKMGPKKPK